MVFVGYNPGLTSGRIGHYYAHPSNRFWQLLADAKLTERRYRPEEDGLLLGLGYGFTDLVRRMSRSSQDLHADELKEGGEEVRRQLREVRPRIAAFTGKGVAAAVIGQRAAHGWLRDEVVPGVRGMVLCSPSGLAGQSYHARLAPYRELGQAVSALRTAEQTASQGWPAR